LVVNFIIFACNIKEFILFNNFIHLLCQNIFTNTILSHTISHINVTLGYYIEAARSIVREAPPNHDTFWVLGSVYNAFSLIALTNSSSDI